MKTIVITSYHALISRNILGAGVLPHLLESDTRVVLLVPPSKVAYFREYFRNDRVFLEGIVVPPRKLDEFVQLVSLALVGIENHIVRGWKTEGNYGKYYLAVILHRILSPFFIFQRLFRALARNYLKTNVFDELFQTYAPDMVFTTDSFNRDDAALLIASKRRGIRTVGMIRSWDNATTKGVFIPDPDQIVVTNDVLEEEMVSLHKLAPWQITVSGIPHYDAVHRPPTVSREQFFKELGLDLNKKTILYAPGGKILYKHDAEILSLFKHLVDTGKFTHPVQFIVRFPPGDSLDASPVQGDPHFIIDDPGTNVTGKKKESEMSRNDQDHLHNSLVFADIILTLASTMIIDGTVYDKPVVVFGYDPVPNLDDPIAKFVRYVHLRKLLGSGLVTVSKNNEEFIRDMNAYLNDPSFNQSNREEIVRRYTRALDGQSAKRVADTILNQLRP